MADAPTLWLPRSQMTRKAHQEEGSAFRILPLNGFTRREDLQGAELKIQDHQLLLDMYYRHPTIFSAINKIVKVCTNTGYDFVPRGSRNDVNEEEYKRAEAFFKTQHDFIGELRRVYRDLLIFGDAYLYVVPDRRRRPVKLKRLAPWTIHINAAKNGKVNFYIQKDLTQPQISPVRFPPNQILHFKMDDPGSDLYGLSPLESLKEIVTTDFYMQKFNQQYFRNGASTGTIFNVKDASEEDLERARDVIREQYVGTENAFVPLVVGGDVEVHPGAFSHSDMAFLEGREFIIEEILSVLDVPPAKLGRMETANRSNSKEQDKSFRTEAVSPLQYNVESVVNDQFLRNVLGITDTLFKHSESDVRDAQEQMDLWKDAVQNGLLTINEVRAMMGYGPVEGGDIPYVSTPTGAMPVNLLPEYFRFPQVAPPLAGQPAQATPSEPPTDERTEVEVGLRPANKNLAIAQQWLTKARTDPRALRQAWSYVADEVSDAADKVVHDLEALLRKAQKVDDSDLSLAYIERAQGLFSLLPVS